MIRKDHAASPSATVSENELPFPSRFRRYLSERFPLHQNGPLIVTFTFSAASYSRICAGESGFIPLNRFIVGAITVVLLFLLLRIADEFKDFEDDSRYRSYRAVPRGLVSLRELGISALVIIAFQVIINILFMPGMLIPFCIVLAYLGIMTKEFFVPVWLKKHPFIYMGSHMFIMPMIDLYTTGLDWINEQRSSSPELILFLIVSFTNGVIIEMGRKIRAKEAEEEGVETYSALLGETAATGIWLSVAAVTFVVASVASYRSGFALPGIPLLCICLFAAVYFAVRFIRNRIQKNARKIEMAAGLWTIGMYLILGATPALLSFIESW
jgi:hypothetical protein